MRAKIGSEYAECVALSNWLDLTRWKYTYVPMDTFTPYFGVHARNRAMGVHKGVPDYLVSVRRTDGTHRLCFVEMKKPKGGRLSPEQVAWIEELNSCEGVAAVKCDTASQAAEWLLSVSRSK